MFLLFNKVYLKDDSYIDSMKYRNIVISKSQGGRFKKGGLQDKYYTNTDYCSYTVTSLLEESFDGSIQKFFDHLKTIEGKYFIHCDKFAFEELQFTLWKSIYGEDKAELVWMIYNTYMDLINSKVDIWMSGNSLPLTAKPEREWNRLDKTMFTAKFQRMPTITGIDYSTLSLEHIFPYLYQENHYLKKVVEDRCLWMMKRKLYREIVDIKETMLRHGYLLSLVPGIDQLDLKPGSFKKLLIENDSTKFLMDDRFILSEIDYCINAYNLEALDALVTFVFGLEGGYYLNENNIDRYVDDNDPKAIELDISKGNRGTLINSFSDTRMNTYLLSYYFLLILKDRKEELSQFLLKPQSE